MGVFPVKKLVKSDGVTVVPIHFCNMLARWLFCNIVVFGISVPGGFYAISKLDDHDYPSLLNAMFSSLNLTVTDTLTTWTTMIVYYLASIVILWRNYVVST